MQTNIQWTPTKVEITLWGNVTPEDIVHTIEDVTDDARFTAINQNIIDARRLNAKLIKPLFLKTFQQVCTNVIKTRPDLKIAFIGREFMRHDIEDHYLKESETGDCQCLFFNDYTEAIEWLQYN